MPKIQPETVRRPNKTPFFLAMFFVFHLFAGFDLGYIKHLEKKSRYFIRLVQFLVVLCISLILIVPGESSARTYGLFISGIEYLSLVICLQITKYNLYHFIEDIHKIDDGYIQVMDNKIGIYSILAFFSVFVLKAFMCFAFCSFFLGQNLSCPCYLASGSVTCACSLVVDGLAILEMVINHYVYRSLKHLMGLLNIHVALEKVINTYVSIADCYDNIMPLYGKLVLGELGASIPKAMIMSWHMIMSIKKNEGWFASSSQAVFILHIMFQFCVPAASAEMINTEVRAIKLLLNNRLINEPDPEKKKDLLRIIQYMESRKLEYKLCRVIPVDMRLIVTILNLSTTYFIVIIQFTHLL